MIIRNKEEETRRTIVKFLYNDEYPYVTREGNVIHAEKAFKVASVIIHCVENNLSVSAYLKQLINFHKGKIDLIWKNGILKIKKLTTKRKKV